MDEFQCTYIPPVVTGLHRMCDPVSTTVHSPCVGKVHWSDSQSCNISTGHLLILSILAKQVQNHQVTKDKVQINSNDNDIAYNK